MFSIFKLTVQLNYITAAAVNKPKAQRYGVYDRIRDVKKDFLIGSPFILI
jgi:hypothetical protein